MSSRARLEPIERRPRTVGPNRADPCFPPVSIDSIDLGCVTSSKYLLTRLALCATMGHVEIPLSTTWEVVMLRNNSVRPSRSGRRASTCRVCEVGRFYSDDLEFVDESGWGCEGCGSNNFYRVVS